MHADLLIAVRLPLEEGNRLTCLQHFVRFSCLINQEPKQPYVNKSLNMKTFAQGTVLMNYSSKFFAETIHASA